MLSKHCPLKVFLCHSSHDKPAVREVYSRLKGEKWIEPWLDEEEILPGQDWNTEIEKAVEKTDIVVVFLSNNSVSKEGYVQYELRFALKMAKYKPQETLFIIPIRLDNCSVPRSLSMWQYVDAFPENRKDWAYGRLLKSLDLRTERKAAKEKAKHETAGEVAKERAKREAVAKATRGKAEQETIKKAAKEEEVKAESEEKRSEKKTSKERKLGTKKIFLPSVLILFMFALVFSFPILVRQYEMFFSPIATQTKEVIPKLPETATATESPVIITLSPSKTNVPMIVEDAVSTETTRSEINQALAKIQTIYTGNLSEAVYLFDEEGEELKHRENAYTEEFCADTIVRNFVMKVEFHNPYDGLENYWDYGVLFRDTGNNQQFRLYLVSRKTWGLILREGENMNWLKNKYLGEELNRRDNQSNTIYLIVSENSGYFYLNEKYIDTLDLSAKTISGKVCVATGMFGGNTRDGETTVFSDFILWSLP